MNLKQASRDLMDLLMLFYVVGYRVLVENGKNSHKYIRYTAEDLDRMLGEFFEGKT